MDWLGIAASVATVLSVGGGAIFGVYKFIRAKRQPKRSVIVKVDDTGIIFNQGLPNSARRAVIITAENHGLVPVTLKEGGLFLPNGHKLIAPFQSLGVTFPHVLQPGDSCNLLLPGSGLAQQVERNGFGAGVRVQGFYRDGLNTFHKSKPIALDPDRLLK